MKNIQQDYDLDLLREIQREKELELIESHRELFNNEMKKVSKLSERDTYIKFYNAIMSTKNIERYYNLPMKKFMELFYNGDIKLNKK